MRVLKYFITIIVFALLQTTILPCFEISGAVPDILFAFVIAAGIYEAPDKASFAGLACGIVTDSLSAGAFGFNSLAFSYIGFAVSFLRINYFQMSRAVHLFFTATGGLIYYFVYYFFTRFIWGDVGFFTMIFKIIMPQLIYTLIASVPVYMLYVKFIGERRTS